MWPTCYKGVKLYIQLHREKALPYGGDKNSGHQEKSFCSVELGSFVVSVIPKSISPPPQDPVLPVARVCSSLQLQGPMPGGLCSHGGPACRFYLPLICGTYFSPEEIGQMVNDKSVFSSLFISNSELNHQQISQPLQTQFLHLQMGIIVELVGLG